MSLLGEPKRARARPHTHTHTHTHARTHAHTHARTHARTHAHTHTHTHVYGHAHSFYLSLCFSSSKCVALRATDEYTLFPASSPSPTVLFISSRAAIHHQVAAEVTSQDGPLRGGAVPLAVGKLLRSIRPLLCTTSKEVVSQGGGFLFVCLCFSLAINKHCTPRT